MMRHCATGLHATIRLSPSSLHRVLRPFVVTLLFYLTECLLLNLLTFVLLAVPVVTRAAEEPNHEVRRKLENSIKG